jgi:ABC-type uncharacterized transport system ATPase subunit
MALPASYVSGCTQAELAGPATICLTTHGLEGIDVLCRISTYDHGHMLYDGPLRAFETHASTHNPSSPLGREQDAFGISELKRRSELI